MSRRHKNYPRLLAVGNWLGRKFIALLFVSVLVLVSGFFAPDQCGTIGATLVGLYAAFVGAHATTDVMGRKVAALAQRVNPPPPPAAQQVANTAKKGDQDDDVD